ncbi:glycosyltransferase [Jatrophihabitans sp. YIM 134969]
MTLAVLVVSYRRAELLEACLRSVAEHLPDSPVAVWDNASDGTPAVREVAGRNPHVHWVFSPTNVGFAAAVNGLAAELAPDHDLLLLNPDAVLTGDLGRSRALLEMPRVAAVAPRGDGTDTAHRPLTLVRALVSEAGHADRFRGRRWSDLYAGTPDEVEGYLTGACLLIARAAWDELGGFDDSFALYGEEADLQRRAREAGWRLLLAPETGHTHTTAGTVADDPLLARRSRDLLHEAQAHRLQTTAGVHRADAYAAGVGVLERVQRSKRTVAPRTGSPAVVFSTNTLDVGGAERLQVHLANALAERGLDVTMVCVQRFGALTPSVSPAVRLVRRPWWAAGSLPSRPGRAVLLTNETHTEAGLALGWRTGRRDRRWFVAAHTPVAPDGPTYSGHLVAAMRRADGIVALSSSHATDLRRHHHLGDRFVVIGNGVTTAEPTAPVADDGPVRLVFVGRMVELKNPHLLVAALDRLPPSLPWTLDLWGDGPDRARLEALTPSHLRERVRWRGWAADPGAAIAAADLLCLPSRAEVFPLTVLEAMARGVPVIASGVASVPEILDRGRAGLVVEPVTVEAWAAALGDLLPDRARLRALGAAGRERMLASYTLEATVDRYETLVREAFG